MRLLFMSQGPENPNARDSHNRVEQLLRSYCSPGTELDLGYPPDFQGARVWRAMGAQNTLTGLHHALGAPEHIRLVVWAQDQRYDAVIQSNTFDPGVEAGRLAVRIPVIGVFRTTLHVATTLADRIGVTVPLPGHVPYTRRILRSYGMDQFVTEVRSVGQYGADIESRRDQLFSETVKTMQGLIMDTGAEAIIPLGGALIPYIVSPDDLAKEVGVPVYNTKSIGISFAEMCVRFDITHSPVTYPSAKLSADDFTAQAY
jgi:Asp/Glu/hydantoin racemase